MKIAESGESAQLKLKQENDEHAKLMEENRFENERIAKEREIRLSTELEIIKENALQALLNKEQEEELSKAKLIEFIKEQEVKYLISLIQFQV